MDRFTEEEIKELQEKGKLPYDVEVVPDHPNPDARSDPSRTTYLNEMIITNDEDFWSLG